MARSRNLGSATAIGHEGALAFKTSMQRILHGESPSGSHSIFVAIWSVASGCLKLAIVTQPKVRPTIMANRCVRRPGVDGRRKDTVVWESDENGHRVLEFGWASIWVLPSREVAAPSKRIWVSRDSKPNWRVMSDRRLWVWAIKVDPEEIACHANQELACPGYHCSCCSIAKSQTGAFDFGDFISGLIIDGIMRHRDCEAAWKVANPLKCTSRY